MQVVRAQLLSEMEELMDYKKMQADGVKDNLLPLRNTWTKRLKGMQKNIEVRVMRACVVCVRRVPSIATSAQD